MKNKFIRILSPITLGVIAILDAAVIAYGIFAVKKLMEARTASVIIFAAIEIFAIIIGILITKEAISNGVIFREDECEFTGVDENNIISYDEVEKIETFKDTAASLRKNFIDRHALIIFTLKDEKVITIDIGITTIGTVKKISDELSNYIDKEKIKNTEIKTSDIFKKEKSKKKEDVKKEEE